MSGHFGLVIGCFSSSESLLEGMMPCFCSENDSGLLFSTDCPVMKKPLPVSLCSERNVYGREMFLSVTVVLYVETYCFLGEFFVYLDR